MTTESERIVTVPGIPFQTDPLTVALHRQFVRRDVESSDRRVRSERHVKRNVGIDVHGLSGDLVKASLCLAVERDGCRHARVLHQFLAKVTRLIVAH